MTSAKHDAHDETIFAFLAQGRPVQVTDAEYLAYVTGLPKAQVKAALSRLEASGRIRIGADGRWAVR
jgi:hypothetical protein